MNEAQEFFQELLFGSGAWLGLILIIAIMVLASAKTKIGGIPMLIIGIFVGIMYFDNVDASTNFFWSGIIMFIISPILGAYSAYRMAKND